MPLFHRIQVSYTGIGFKNPDDPQTCKVGETHALDGNNEAKNLPTPRSRYNPAERQASCDIPKQSFMPFRNHVVNNVTCIVPVPVLT